MLGPFTHTDSIINVHLCCFSLCSRGDCYTACCHSCVLWTRLNFDTSYHLACTAELKDKARPCGAPTVPTVWFTCTLAYCHWMCELCFHQLCFSYAHKQWQWWKIYKIYGNSHKLICMTANFGPLCGSKWPRTGITWVSKPVIYATASSPSGPWIPCGWYCRGPCIKAPRYLPSWH